jgi:preprotein translocase subunit YajC
MLEFFVLLAQKEGSKPVSMWPVFIIIGVLFYVLLLRPQQKQRKEHQQLLSNIKTGDKVITIGGIYGLVTNVKNGILVLKIAEGVKIEVTRDAIRAVVNGKEGSPPEQPAQPSCPLGRR